jgi:predicted RND superfamily exporter protein
VSSLILSLVLPVIVIILFSIFRQKLSTLENGKEGNASDQEVKKQNTSEMDGSLKKFNILTFSLLFINIIIAFFWWQGMQTKKTQ